MSKLNRFNLLRYFKILHHNVTRQNPRLILSLLSKNIFSVAKILVYKKEIVNYPEYEKNKINGFSIIKGEVNELIQLDIQEKNASWEFKCHDYDGVSDFFIAKNEEGIQHISWIYYAGDHNRILVLDDKSAEIKYCLTMPKWRGFGIYPVVLYSIQNYLFTNGFERVYICVHEENYSSIRGIEKAKFQFAGKVLLMKAFGLQVSRRLNVGR